MNEGITLNFSSDAETYWVLQNDVMAFSKMYWVSQKAFANKVITMGGRKRDVYSLKTCKNKSYKCLLPSFLQSQFDSKMAERGLILVSVKARLSSFAVS